MKGSLFAYGIREKRPTLFEISNKANRGAPVIRCIYGVIALTPSTPAIAVTTATATFRIILQTDFLIAIITPTFTH